jgi:hypothetical protein
MRRPGIIALLLALSTAALHAQQQPAVPPADPPAVEAEAVEAEPAPEPSPVRVAMGTVCPVYDAPPGEEDMRCDVVLGVSLRPESWRRLPRLHPWVGVGSKSLALGVAWAASERYAFGVGAMALREDYLDVGRVAPCVAFTINIGGGD